jgi:nucleotide-binding universal stress UspA family protein
MNQDSSYNKNNDHDLKTMLVALDFSECSKTAYRKACDIFQDRFGRIIALHVIDSDFVKRCVTNHLGEESRIKKDLFQDAKKRLHEFINNEKRSGIQVEAVVCEGIPYLEINRKAQEFSAELIIMGSCGRAGDTDKIFFGSTAEKVLRFIIYPVLCIPPNTEYK